MSAIYKEGQYYGKEVSIDNALNNLSENPVQNKVITENIAPLLVQTVEGTTVAMTTIDGNYPPKEDIKALSKYLVYNTYTGGSYYNVQWGYTILENGVDISNNFEVRIWTSGRQSGIELRAIDGTTHSITGQIGLYGYSQAGVATGTPFSSTGVASLYTSSIGTSWVRIGRSSSGGDWIYFGTGSSGSFGKDVLNSNVQFSFSLGSNDTLIENTTFIYNGALKLTSQFQELQNDVTALKSRENIRTYFDTATNDLYITNDGSDPTPASN